MKNNFFLKIIIFISVFSFFITYTYLPQIYYQDEAVLHNMYEIGIESFCYNPDVPYNS